MPSVIDFFLVILISFASVTANSLLRIGMQKTALESLLPSYLIKNFTRVFLNPYIICGFATYVIGSLLWLYVLSHEPLNRSYPIFIGFTIFFLVVGSYFILKEVPTVMGVVGLALILLGTIFVFRT